MKLILDTDIGTDVDDVLALALLLASPEIELTGVTCVYGDTLLRSRMARKMLNLRGKDGVPVYAGTSVPLMRLREVYWGGWEGQGLLTDEDNEVMPEPDFAPDWIVKTARQFPGEVHLAAIGPLTNLALALLQEPKLPELLNGITIMGGVVRGANDLHLPFAEHNILCDPDAAHVVFSSGLRITLAPLNITVQARLTRDSLKRIQAGGTAFHMAVADQLARYPHFERHGWTCPHDPLAIATLLRPDLFQFLHVDIDVESAGRVSTGAIFPRATEQGKVLLVRSVDALALEEYLVATLET